MYAPATKMELRIYELTDRHGFGGFHVREGERCIYIYIYIYTIYTYTDVYTHVYIYIRIYTHTYRHKASLAGSGQSVV